MSIHTSRISCLQHRVVCCRLLTRHLSSSASLVGNRSKTDLYHSGYGWRLETKYGIYIVWIHWLCTVNCVLWQWLHVYIWVAITGHILLLLLLLLLRPFNGLFSRTIWARWHEKGKPFWFLLAQEMMGWQWHQLDVCKSFASRSTQTTTPVPHSHNSVFYRLDALPAAQPTVSKHWRHICHRSYTTYHHNRFTAHRSSYI